MTTAGLLLVGLPAATSATAADVPAPTAVRPAHAVDGALSMRWNEVKGAAGDVLSRSDARVLAPVEVTDGRLDVVAQGWLNGLTITRLDDEADTTGGNR